MTAFTRSTDVGGGHVVVIYNEDPDGINELCVKGIQTL